MERNRNIPIWVKLWAENYKRWQKKGVLIKVRGHDLKKRLREIRAEIEEKPAVQMSEFQKKKRGISIIYIRSGKKTHRTDKIGGIFAMMYPVVQPRLHDFLIRECLTGEEKRKTILLLKSMIGKKFDSRGGSTKAKIVKKIVEKTGNESLYLPTPIYIIPNKKFGEKIYPKETVEKLKKMLGRKWATFLTKRGIKIKRPKIENIGESGRKIKRG